MSMFKKIFKNPTVTGKGKDRSDSGHDLSHGMSGTEGFEGRPFEINVNAVWNYDHDELCEFIQKYESYTNSLAAKYNELLHGHIVAKEKLDLLERERKRLMQDNEQQKIYIDNLKQSLNEQSLSEPSSSSLRVTTTPSEKRQIEELIKEKVKIKGIDVGLLDEVRMSGENIISQLSEVKSIMQSSEPNANGANGSTEDHTNAQESQNATDSEKEPQDADGEEKVSITVKKSFKENFSQIVDDLEMTFQLILPKFLAINEGLKKREKEIAETLKGDFLDALRQIDEGFTERVSTEQAAELESKANDLRHKLVKAESALSELGAEVSSKNEQLEKVKKAHEKTEMELKRTQQLIDEQIEASGREIEQLTKKISELEEKVKISEREVKMLKAERLAKETQAEKIIEDNKMLQEMSEKSEEERNSKIQELLKTKNQLEEDKNKLNKKIGDLDQEKNDIENKLIQEKLKHHQTQTDLQKLKETSEQSQKDLNEEIEGRKEDLRKMEELKKQLVESDRKGKEYKKTAKKLSQQILDLQNKIHADNKEREKDKLTEVVVTEHSKLETQENEHVPSINNDELVEKTQLISEQHRKIQELREELEKALLDLSTLKRDYTALKEKKEELESQGKILHEKREKGLQEISRLTALIDDIKAKNPGISIPQQRPVVSAQFSHQKSTTNPPVRTHQHSQSISLSGARPVSNINTKHSSDFLKGIRTNLNNLYKEVILAITTEKLLETDPGSRTSGRLDSSTMDNNISESLIRIEKKVNDVMFMLHEYSESLE